MMQHGTTFSRGALALLMAGLAMGGVCGCQTGGGNQPPAARQVIVPPISIGDNITVVLGDIPNQPPSEFKDKVKEDGTIGLLHRGKSFKAAGKTALQLQKEIYDAYVPSIYQSLSVSVTTDSQYYTVTGWVKAASQYQYVGPTTVSKAIATAGYFDQYGSHKVLLIRANGETHEVDYDRALKRPELDLPVFPGDRIEVPKRGLFK